MILYYIIFYKDTFFNQDNMDESKQVHLMLHLKMALRIIQQKLQPFYYSN